MSLFFYIVPEEIRKAGQIDRVSKLVIDPKESVQGPRNKEEVVITDGGGGQGVVLLTFEVGKVVFFCQKLRSISQKKNFYWGKGGQKRNKNEYYRPRPV